MTENNNRKNSAVQFGSGLLFTFVVPLVSPKYYFMREKITVTIKGKVHNIQIEKIQEDAEYTRYEIYGRDRKVTLQYSNRRNAWYLINGQMSNDSIIEITKQIK